MDPSGLLETALGAASRAGDLLLERFAGPATGVGSKSTPTDLVSDADRASEELLRELIERSHPDDGILGEEGEGKDSRSGRLWVLDPLDATVNFLFKIPWWAVSIGVQDRDGDLVGVVRNPVMNETFAAVRGGGATMNGSPIRVSDRSDLSGALVATGFAYDARARSRQAAVVQSVLPRVRDIRRMGSAALDLCSLACGRIDGFYESNLEEWDKAAGRLIVREAGGVVGEIEPPLSGMAPGVVAANPGLHDELRRLVTDADS